jgi:putative FmdB family regulatory protein
MPIYEYDCPKCGRFDAIQKMSDKPLRTHDVCGSRVQKLISAGAFAFKGSGFYVTDYKKREKGTAASEPGKSEPGKSEAGKSEAGKGEAGKGEAGKGEAGKASPAKNGKDTKAA